MPSLLLALALHRALPRAHRPPSLTQCGLALALSPSFPPPASLPLTQHRPYTKPRAPCTFLLLQSPTPLTFCYALLICGKGIPYAFALLFCPTVVPYCCALLICGKGTTYGFAPKLSSSFHFNAAFSFPPRIKSTTFCLSLTIQHLAFFSCIKPQCLVLLCLYPYVSLSLPCNRRPCPCSLTAWQTRSPQSSYLSLWC